MEGIILPEKTMATIAKNNGFVALTEAQMLEEWKKRRGFYAGIRSCDVERDDGVDLDGVLQREYGNWYARLLREAPAEMLPIEDIAGECTVGIDARRVATITLPYRAIRPLSLRLDGWQTSIEQFCNPDSDEALAQRSEWTQAGSERPVVMAGPRWLKAYSAPTADAAIESLQAVCIPADGTYRFRQDAWTWLDGYFDLV